MPVIRQPAQSRLAANRAEQQRINTLTTDDDKQKARDAINQAGNEAIYETTKRHLMRALVSPSQLREQMTWFWMNHFSVLSGKANLRWTLAEYEDAVRAHALGRFADLVMATVKSPAMLEYLDNAQSAVGKINENYARELMELHTLGVSGGPSGSTYTQGDVQELARVLTGVGVYLTDNPPKLPSVLQPLYVHDGLFEFNPARHDAGVKMVLGRRIDGKGFGEVEEAIELLCRQPATARFISTKLATYFVADEPPRALVERMTRTFQKTDGSIRAVLHEMFLDPSFIAALNASEPPLEKFKDPMQFVVSSIRLAYDGKAIVNYRPMIGWLQQLGEPLYGRVTPDGYPLTEAAWSSSGQTRAALRDWKGDRRRQRGPVQQRRQHARSDHRVSDAQLTPVLRGDRAGAERARTRCARPLSIAAGVEHGPAGVAGLDATLGTRTEVRHGSLPSQSAEAGDCRRRIPAAARSGHRLAGVCRAGGCQREVPARLPERWL